ncbi:hypothetical protein [Rhodopseudomonas pseudopalustris]|uniref:Uncharacterized protein n=2 Tax=Rhodopseudomonas TaxID=1073 RepID=Q133V5_RHOPS|nr:hypothetical protein [Rhodopseudomonas pseudopalustris]ABE40634.1 hypothetical protein RPD_3410 [Rhodopseudomonas palustris BisB5]MBB1091367.1 hypothetical protein [Rhodopseudomonas palustris]SEO53001.1 hypothetical protein SAMN05444123_103199 [Rhodopseudomonas pseudopalustris]
MIKDDDYELDSAGNRVLIGLTSDETAEFFRLDEIISKSGPPPVNDNDWYRPEDRRWLELYEKHESARRPFLKSSKTVH